MQLLKVSLNIGKMNKLIF